ARLGMHATIGRKRTREDKFCLGASVVRLVLFGLRALARVRKKNAIIAPMRFAIGTGGKL
ncbi:MAG: hypothetical protein ABIJ53_00800, partial [Verrucomicrobiota bacterium]